MAIDMNGVTLKELQDLADDPTLPPEDQQFHFDDPEDVLIWVICLLEDGEEGDRTSWSNWSIEQIEMLKVGKGAGGAAEYDRLHGVGLDYTLRSILDVPTAEGVFVVEGITGVYHRGDGWTTDDDMEFAYKAVRPATAEEKTMFGLTEPAGKDA